MPPSPNGLPTATTQSPICAALLSPKADIGQRLVGVDLQHREIGARVAADDLGGVFAVVLQGHLDLGGLADDVVVGDDVARGVDDKAGAERDALDAVARHSAGRRTGAGPAGRCRCRCCSKKRRSNSSNGELRKPSGRLRPTSARRRRLLGDRDVDDRRQHPLDQRGKALLRRAPASARRCGGVGGGRGALGPDQRRQRQRRRRAPAAKRDAAPALPPGRRRRVRIEIEDVVMLVTPASARGRPRLHGRASYVEKWRIGA